MKRIGIDVGGTNTDAVLIEDDVVVASVKTFTTADVTSGVRDALTKIVQSQALTKHDVDAVMIGTTHYTNAVAERQRLSAVAAVRISLPAAASLKPFCDWPAELSAVVNGGVYMVHGGHEYDGREIVPMDEQAVASAAREIRCKGINAIAVSATFSPLTSVCETRAMQIIKNEHPEAHISLSSALGRIGLLERENVALLNASLVNLATKTTEAFKLAIESSGLQAKLFITQNDGTIAPADTAVQYPVFSFASGPTNSMRGAALLSGIDQAMVCDVGGTTSDIGCLINGFPRQANAVVKVGGVRTLFRMPDLLSIAIGGGSRVSSDGMAVGPQSLGYRLAEQAMVFGGEHLCATDIAVAAGLADIGDASLVQNIDSATVTESIMQIHRRLADAIDSMKSDATEVPLLAVGGGAMLVPSTIDGISEVVQVENGAVANAVGAAIAQISGETDRVYHDVDRADALADAKQLAVNAAVEAGADASSIRTVEMEDLPLSYLPGNSLRVRVRVVGDLKTSTCSEADVRVKI